MRKGGEVDGEANGEAADDGEKEEDCPQGPRLIDERTTTPRGRPPGKGLGVRGLRVQSWRLEIVGNWLCCAGGVFLRTGLAS